MSDTAVILNAVHDQLRDALKEAKSKIDPVQLMARAPFKWPDTSRNDDNAFMEELQQWALYELIRDSDYLVTGAKVWPQLDNFEKLLNRIRNYMSLC